MRHLAALAVLLASALAACGGGSASLAVSNTTTADAHVVVTSGDRKISVVVAAKGRVDLGVDSGTYSLVVMPNTQWLDETRALRQNLVGQLTSGALERDTVVRVFDQFDEIEFRLTANNYAGKSGTKACTGKGGGSVTIGQAGSGATASYTLACT